MKKISPYILILIFAIPSCWLIPQAYYSYKTLEENFNEPLGEPVRSLKLVHLLQEEGDGGLAIETTEQIKDYIRLRANFNSVDPELAITIAQCESYPELYNTCHCDSGTPFQNNCVENCSKGIGIFKITQSTFDEAVSNHWVTVKELNELTPYKIEDNIRIAIWMMSDGHYEKWSQSEWCWNTN